jgi:peptidyl-prolyl cis-trans isomerase SurA
LNSEINSCKEELLAQSGGDILITDCEMLEQIMHRKLLAHHAEIDSIFVGDAEIEANVQRKLAYFSQQLGSPEKMLELYGFDSMKDLKDELYRVEKESMLITKMQQTLTMDVDITPEEVKRYYNSLEAEDNLPEIGTEIEISQIVLNANPTLADVKQAIDKLKELKKEVEDGASFKMKAILYSDDPAVTQNSGLYTIDRNSQFVKEFKEAAFSLEVGEISDPFKSDFGYHILIVEKVKGKERDVRHILIKPKVGNEIYVKAKDSLAKYRDDILRHKLTFEEAVIKYSQDKDTRLNQGVVVNSETRDTHFDLTRMPPELYSKVGNLKQGDISEVFYEESREGNKTFKIILLKSKTEAHTADISQDYVKIKNLAIQKKKTEVIEKWANEIIQDTYIKISSDYFDCNFESNWAKK